jgi:hypothetical protein
MIQITIFIHSDYGHAKANKPLENEAKKVKRRLNLGQRR